MTFITNKHLKNMPSGNCACKSARKWFKSTFPKDQYPDGVPMRNAWDVLKADINEDQHLNWLIWFGCNQLDSEKRQNFAWFAAGLAMRHAGIAEFADNVTAENWMDARARARANARADANANAAYAAYAAYAAAHAAAYAVDAAAHAADAADADAKTELVEQLELLLF